MLILILAQKVVCGTISDNMTQNNMFRPFLAVFFGQTPLRYCVAMATPKVPGDQKLFERACVMLKIKVTKFQLHTHNGFLAVLKIQLGGGGGGGLLALKPSP